MTYALGGPTARTGYSFKQKAPVSEFGDLILGADVDCSDHTANFAFRSDKFLGLGTGLPKADFALPRDFWDAQYPPLSMKVSHYYYVVAGGKHCLVQALSLGHTIRLKPTYLTHYHEVAVNAAFRFVSADSLLSLRDRIQLAVAEAGSENGSLARGGTNEGGFAKVATNASGRHADGEADKAATQPALPLTPAYEQWQKDRKAFMELPVEKARLQECSAILTRGKELDSQIEGLLTEVDITITSKRGQITALETRAKELANPQVRDRVQTIITELTRQVAEAVSTQKLWTVQRESLQKSRAELSEYRGVLEVIKRK